MANREYYLIILLIFLLVPTINATRTATTDTTCTGINGTKQVCRNECLDWDTYANGSIYCLGGMGDVCKNISVGQECTKTLYSGLMNYYNGNEYVPINTTIVTTSGSYSYKMIESPYNLYFKNNSNTAEAVRFEKNGYFFIYDVSGGQILWAVQDGKPDATDTLGGGKPSNSQDTHIAINGSTAIYGGAFYNTNITYEVFNEMLKETYTLYGLPSYKDYYYLQYSGNIKFNKSLQICTDAQCYIPSGTQDDFETSGKIYFKTMANQTIFYLKEPIITDSNGTSILGVYKVKGSDAQMNFKLRINKTFLQNAVYPVMIDPTITFDSDTINLGDTYVDPSTANTNYGTNNYLKVGYSQSSSSKERTYIKINSTPILALSPSNINLGLYYSLTNLAHPVHKVYYGTPYNESNMTWNNQPCGTSFNNSSACNLTAYTNLTSGASGQYRYTNVTGLFNDSEDTLILVFKDLQNQASSSSSSYTSKEYSSYGFKIQAQYLYTTNQLITDCTDLDSSIVYNLTDDIKNSTTGSCMHFLNDNIVLDCQGHLIDGNNVADYAFYSNGYKNLTIENCVFSDWDTYVGYIYNTDNLTLSNSNILDTINGGFYVYNSDDVKILNSTLKGNSDNTLSINYESKRLTLADSTIAKGTTGIQFNSVIVPQLNFTNVKINTSSLYDVDFRNNNEVGTQDCSGGFFNNVTNLQNSKYYYYLTAPLNLSGLTNISQIILCKSDNVTIQNNIFDNISYNIIIQSFGTKGVQIFNNTFTGFYNHIYLDNDRNMSIYNNIFNNSLNHAIMSYNIFNNSIYSNTYSNNVGNDIYFNAIGDGISRHNSIFNNIFYSETNTTIYIGGSSYDKVYNNIINSSNLRPILRAGGDAFVYLNTSNTTGTRILSDGFRIGGNYWTNPTATGYSNTCSDSNNDGYCDTPYNATNSSSATFYGIDFFPYSTNYTVTSNLIIVNSSINLTGNYTITNEYSGSLVIGKKWFINGIQNYTDLFIINISDLSDGGNITFSMQVNSTYSNSSNGIWRNSSIYQQLTVPIMPTISDYSLSTTSVTLGNPITIYASTNKESGFIQYFKAEINYSSTCAELTNKSLVLISGLNWSYGFYSPCAGDYQVTHLFIKDGNNQELSILPNLTFTALAAVTPESGGGAGGTAVIFLGEAFTVQTLAGLEEMTNFITKGKDYCYDIYTTNSGEEEYSFTITCESTDVSCKYTTIQNDKFDLVAKEKAKSTICTNIPKDAITQRGKVLLESNIIVKNDAEQVTFKSMMQIGGFQGILAIIINWGTNTFQRSLMWSVISLVSGLTLIAIGQQIRYVMTRKRGYMAKIIVTAIFLVLSIGIHIAIIGQF